MNQRIAVLGLGYVGLPLAVEFGKHFETVGLDINEVRIQELTEGFDRTREVSSEELASSPLLRFTSEPSRIASCNVFIVTVPTPIDAHNQPDLTPLIKASRSIGHVLKKGDLVIYESTVFPGATEEVCVPVLESVSGLTFNTDFTCGYSPERINPGDKERTLTKIIKVTSGSTPEAAEVVDNLYRTIIHAGTHLVSSIKIAEAAKVIENTQRDVNIALVNELARLFSKLDIDTEKVLEAAGTKWNFLPFAPGLVGGHCIGVDPYYLTHKALEVGFHPEMILAGRRLNDSMGRFVADEVSKLMTQRRIHIVNARILILGLTFKENCPDLRNTKVVDVIHEFESFNADVDVYDPWSDPVEAMEEFGFRPIDAPDAGTYDAIVLAVSHSEFKDWGVAKIRSLGKANHVLYDVKNVFAASEVDGRL